MRFNFPFSSQVDSANSSDLSDLVRPKRQMKTQAADLQRFLSDEARRRPASQLRGMMDLMNRPGMIALSGGMPMASMFPFDDVRATSLSAPFKKGITEPIVGKSSDRVETEVFKTPAGEANDDLELASALQYGWSSGDVRLRDFVRKHVEIIHDIAFTDWDTCMTVGNTFAWDAVMRTFTNPGDTILVEEFSFPSAMENAIMHGLNLVPVKMDLQGVVPSALETQLENWQGPLPKLFYIIPTGQNPTGSVLSAERRQKIWELASKYDFLIIEDEPYYYLQMDTYAPKAVRPEGNHTRQGLVDSLVPSFLHYDTDGRVIRMDSFSKVMAPGIRLGWFTAQKKFIEALSGYSERSSSKPSGFSQALVYGLLRRWGQDGFLDWLVALRKEYTDRRDICCDAIFEKLPAGKFEIQPPDAGMFFWLKLDARQQSSYKNDGGDAAEVELNLFKAAADNNVLFVPGHWCVAKYVESVNVLPKEVDEKHAIYFRGTFASQTQEDIVEGIARFAKVLELQDSSSYVIVDTQ